MNKAQTERQNTESQNAAQLGISMKALLPLLASIMAMSPLAIDLYLPAMPIIAQALATDMNMMQNTLSIYLLGYALGLLYFGPQADKQPRRKMALIGISGFLMASLLLPFAQSIESFMAIRFVQAFISSAATVVVPGTIRFYYKKNTAKGLSYVSMIMMLAPMVAPTIGSFLLWLDSWQLIFYSLAAYVCMVLLLVYRFLPDSAVDNQRLQISFLARYKLVLSNKETRPDIISSMMISLAFFAYITAIPFVYLTVYQVSEFEFSVLFGVAVFGLMTAHFINSKLVVRKGSRRMLRAGLFVAVCCSTSLVIVNYLQLPLAYTVAALLPLMGSISMIAVNSDALILQQFAKSSGTATAVIGVLRFGVGALAGPILAIFYNGTALPFAMLMWCAVLVVFLCQLLKIKAKK